MNKSRKHINRTHLLADSYAKSKGVRGDGYATLMKNYGAAVESVNAGQAGSTEQQQYLQLQDNANSRTEDIIDQAVSFVREYDRDLDRQLDRDDSGLNELTDTQRQAGIEAAKAFHSARGIYNRRKKEDFKGLESLTYNGELYAPFNFQGSVITVQRDAAGNESLIHANEAYNNPDLERVESFTVAVNMAASKQDEFGEAFFETVVIPTDHVGVVLTARLPTIHEDFVHDPKGVVKEHSWGMMNLLKARRHPEILHNDIDRMYPVYDDNVKEIKDRFVDQSKLQVVDMKLEDGEVIKTGFLKFGLPTFSYLPVCQTPNSKAKGIYDLTDSIAPDVSLSEFLISYSGNGGGLVVVETNGKPEASFVPQTNTANTNVSQTVVLMYEDRFIEINGNTLNTTGAKITGINDYVFKLFVRVSGTLNLATSELTMDGTRVEINQMYKAGVELTPADGDWATGVAVLDKLVLEGWKISARRHNANQRTRGQIINQVTEKQQYTITTLGPVSALMPAIDDSDAAAAEAADNLVKHTGIRASNGAVVALLSHLRLLRSITQHTVDHTKVYNNSQLGICRYFINPTLIDRELDVDKALQTLSTTNKHGDIQSVFTNALLHAVTEMYTNSEFNTVLQFMSARRVRPLVTIGTSPKIATYLQVTGDLRTLGEQFDVKVVTTDNKLMTDRIIFTLSAPGANNEPLENPLNFGNMYWRSEQVIMVNMSRNNTHSKEIRMQPSFNHVPHMPMLGHFTVKNLDKAIQEHAHYSTKTA